MSDIKSVARTWLGTPWQHNQKVKGLGVDCVNFLIEVAKESGLKIEKIPLSYGRTAIDNQIERYLERNFIKKSDLSIEENNILLYRFSGYNNHVAIATSSTTIIHANSKVGKVVEHSIDGVWKRCLESVSVIK
jgi:hypothetical protein